MSRTTKKPYTGSKTFDKQCRSHGGCASCEASKTRYKKIAKDLEKASEADMIV